MLKTLNFVHERSDSLIASKLSSTDISRHVSQTQNIWGNTERKALFIKFSWEQRLYLIMFPTAGFIEDYSTSISGKMQTLWYQWDHYNSQLTEIYDFMSFGRNKKKSILSDSVTFLSHTHKWASGASRWTISASSVLHTWERCWMSVGARICPYRYWQGWVLQCRIWGAGRFSGRQWLSFTRLMVLLTSFMQDTTVLLWPVDVNRKRVINTHRQLRIEEFISILDITITIILNNQAIQLSKFWKIWPFKWTLPVYMFSFSKGFEWRIWPFEWTLTVYMCSSTEAVQ